MSSVFLGGTCNESKWREELISKLTIDYFNPVVPDWTDECMVEERKQREICDYCLYTITPRMTGVFSIAEVIDDSNKRPNKTIFCLLDIDYADITPDDTGYGFIEFDKWQLLSLEQVGKMVERNGGKFFTDLDKVAAYLNNKIIIDLDKLVSCDNCIREHIVKNCIHTNCEDCYCKRCACDDVNLPLSVKSHYKERKESNG